jgi:peptidoglycan/xylan/chitin deacetylase (PgdA/CDA1 family)
MRWSTGKRTFVAAMVAGVLITAAVTVPHRATSATGVSVAAATASAPAVRVGLARPRVVALTFDGGSDLGYAGMILDTLKAKGVHATFGLTGDWAQAHPEMVRRMAAEGHQVLNHTLHHRSFTGVATHNAVLDRAGRQADVQAADAIFTSLTGHSTAPFWRPPYGDTDTSVQADLGAIGYRYFIMWTIDTLGWKGLSASGIVNRVVSRTVPGAIIAGHVGSQSQDGPALGTIIDELRAQGYSFVTVQQAFGM